MELLRKFNSKLHIGILGNTELITFLQVANDVDNYNINIERRYFKNFGHFFLNLLNKKTDIINFLDNVYISIQNDSDSIYSSNILYQILEKESYIDENFIPFYLNSINTMINTKLTGKKAVQRELESFSKEIDYYTSILSSDKNLKEGWKNDIKNAKNSFKQIGLTEEEIDEKIKQRTYSDINQYKIFVEKTKEVSDILYDTQLNILEENYSEKKCKEDVLSKIIEDKNKFIESIDILDFCLNVEKKDYTQNQINFINREMYLPKGRRIFCYEDNDKYLSYMNIDKKLSNREKYIPINEIEKLNKPLQLKLYEINNINELLDIYVSLFIDNNIDLRMCENCCKYFISENGTKYCSNISPQDNSKTCIEIGAKLKYSNKEIPKKYNTIVNRYRSKIKHSTNPKKREYLKKLQTFKEDYRNLKKSKLDENNLEKWLDEKTLEYDNENKISKNNK